jgi:hypothetical protein
MKRMIWAILVIVCLIFVSCKKEPDHVTVQHILIAFKGSIQKNSVKRTRTEAELMAKEIFKRAKQGQDFDKLVESFTDDQYPGIYRMSNFNITPDVSKSEYSRSRMVKAFGDVSFKIPIKGVGLAKYDPETCKYGWHIIKRIE